KSPKGVGPQIPIDKKIQEDKTIKVFTREAELIEKNGGKEKKEIQENKKKLVKERREEQIKERSSEELVNPTKKSQEILEEKWIEELRGVKQRDERESGMI